MMKNLLFNACALSALLLFGCAPKQKKQDESKLENAASPEVSAKMKKLIVDSLPKWGSKKLDMEIQDVQIGGDTLSFISTGWFFYYPYGNHPTINSFKKTYPQFTVIEEKDMFIREATLLYRVKLKDSFVKLIYQPDTERIEIVSGRINDPEFVFENGVKVGMRKEDFVKEFFTHGFSLAGIDHIKVISALDGINHNYHFKDNILRSIELKTDYMVNQN